MGLRSRVGNTLIRVGKAFGPGVPESFQQGEAEAQMTPASPFSPGTPIGPYDGYDRNPRQRDFVTGYNIATRPRVHERVSFDALKGLIEAYDIAQLAIWHRIDSIRSLDWKLVAADDSIGDVSDAIKIGMAALEKPDREHYFDTWFAMWAWDILAYDAGCLYRMRNLAGRTVGLQVVSGPTIAPLLDYWGRSPQAPAEAYVQYVNGLPWNWLTRDDLIYEPFRPRPDSPYGQAPLESIILNANTDLRFQVYFMQRFTEGNLPAAFANAPETWSPDQIEQFQGYWDSFMYGDQSRKHQIRWIPGGSKMAWSNEKDFSDVFSLFMMRKSLAAYHVVPADMGFTENVNRSSGESQADVQHRMGDAPFSKYCSRILTGFLQDDLRLPLRHMFDLGEEQDDRVAQAQADKIYVDMGAVGPSEIREMRYGRPEPDGKPVPRYIFSNRQGPIPIASLMAVAGEIDPETGAPVPGSKLPHMAFSGAEGVVPNPPLRVPGLAEQEFGRSAIPPAPPPQPVMGEPGQVAKEGESGPPGPGITTGTGIHGDPLIRDEEDEDREQAVAKEMAAFRRFERARRKSGEWRDFRFAAVGPVAAHNLNDSGRLAVRKDAGEIAVAGLAVLAADTGRVLMLQRALCDDDPAAGCWEFPGGHMEGAETPLQGAWREWAEETGCIPPPGQQTGTWTSSNGIYQGIVWTVESEASVPVRGHAVTSNPDDPDGDQVEAIAWWNPADLPGNPAVRAELEADITAVLDALGCGGDSRDDCCGAECCAAGCCNGAGGCSCTMPDAVAKAGGDGPKAPMLDTRNLTGVWAEVYGRRNKLLATHQKAIAAAWDACIAELGSPARAVRSFRSGIVPVAKLAGPDRGRWKEAGTAAMLTWLQGLYKTKGYPALVAALEAAIAEGMAEGEADALALAADRAGMAGFAISLAFTAALARLQGGQDINRQAQDAASGMVDGAAGDAGTVLADQAGNDSSEDEMTAAADDALNGSTSHSVQLGTDWKLYAAILAGAVGLYQRDPQAGAGAADGSDTGPILLDWITAGDSRVCYTCQDYADNGPYAPEAVPSYPHGRCRCSVDLTADTRYTSFLGALLATFTN